MRRLIIFACLGLVVAAWIFMRRVGEAPHHPRNNRVNRAVPALARPLRIAEAIEPQARNANAESAAQSHKTKTKQPKSPKEIPAGVEGDFFSTLKVLQIRLVITPEDMGILGSNGQFSRGPGRRFMNEDRPTVKATVFEGGTVYTNVAVHLKGSAGSFRPVDYNPCFTLNFQKFAPGQSFHGLHKLSLNNSVQDRSFLTEKICRELFEAAGVPATRAGHAIVMLNDKNLGMRVLTEGFSKQFLKRYFKNTKGNLYDGGFIQDITSQLAVNSGDNPQDHSGLKALAAAAREPVPATRLARLEQALDMDRFLSFIAMEVMLCHWDGYAMHRNNWRIFHDQEANRMVFFPHGMDQMFGIQRVGPDCPILPYMEGMVAAAIVNTEEGQRRYLERMSQLYAKVFHLDTILKRVDEVAASLRPHFVAASQQTAQYYDQQVQFLKSRITQRDASLKSQLATATPYVFRPLTTMRYQGWRPPGRRGFPNFPPPQ